MASIELPVAFQESLKASETFPENVRRESTSVYPSGLKEYRHRLNSLDDELFITDESHLEFTYRDFDIESSSRTFVSRRRR